jgi:hypothetical protein
VARGDKTVVFQVCLDQIDEPIDVGASANCWPLEGSSGVVIGTLSDDFFDVGAASSLFIVGVTDINVPQVNHADVGFHMTYNILVSSPDSDPPSSAPSATSSTIPTRAPTKSSPALAGASTSIINTNF